MTFKTTLLLMLAATFILRSESAQAEALTTTETSVEYAKESIRKVLSEDLILVPGSIQIEDKTARIVDIGGIARSAFGREKDEYSVRFKLAHRNEGHFKGRVNMTISADRGSSDETTGDNNTTFRRQDPGTGRSIKIQLYGHEDYPKTITLKDLNLKRLSAGE